MSEDQSKKPVNSDEIDLGQLFKMIGNGLNRLFRGFLKIFVYVKKNVFWLGGLAVAGAILGFGLNKLVGVEQQIDVIVTPNLDSKEYLHDVIEEIQANAKAKDTAFFRQLSIDIDKLKGFDIQITPIVEDQSENFEEELEFLELLQKFENSDAMEDIVRAQLMDKGSLDQRISFTFKESGTVLEEARKIMAYINSNDYYKELINLNTENAKQRIRQNDSLIKQIDLLINNYTQKMMMEERSTEGRLVLENEEPLNIPSLFDLKNELIKDTERKKLELKQKQEAITIVNFGKPYRVMKPLFQKNIVLFPLIFIGFFLLITLLKYLNRKSKEMQVE
ncbi:hypothetical protein ACT6NV_06040 [Robiginitalea sp. IMCC44478]|uniref:hypothetical protein n=1 Tax=Robiginitalea sp. IMCC44478 TaxID=3459122 RepID=UPI00404190FE